MTEELRVIMASIKATNGWLSLADSIQNKNFLSDQVIIEKYFGHLCSFNLNRSISRWRKDPFAKFMRLAVAFTNKRLLFRLL